MESQNYGRVPIIWHVPGENLSDVLDIYLGGVIASQKLCREVEKVTDLMPRPYAFAKKLDFGSRVEFLGLDYSQLVSDAGLLEEESIKLLTRIKSR